MAAAGGSGAAAASPGDSGATAASDGLTYSQRVEKRGGRVDYTRMWPIALAPCIPLIGIAFKCGGRGGRGRPCRLRQRRGGTPLRMQHACPPPEAPAAPAGTGPRCATC